MIRVRLTKDDLKIILRDLGSILTAMGFVMLLPLIVVYIVGETRLMPGFLYPAIASIATGLIIRKAIKREEETKLKHAMINAGLVWLIVSLIGGIPFWYDGKDFLSSFFESMSGFTTTGMTLIQDVETVPRSILFWRSLTQWVGGVGVIMLFLVVSMQSRTTIARFYSAEARTDRIKPAISTTIIYIWRIYVFFTFIGIILYYIAGMPWFDAICHAFTSLATGGYSTQNASIGQYNNIGIEAVSILLMLLGGISFVVHYRIITGDRKELIRNQEVRAFLGIIAITTALITLNLAYDGASITKAFRYAIFQVVSIATTTGYTTTNMLQWPEFSKTVLMFLMVTGGCIGSTGGGFKVMRMLVLSKLAHQELIRTILPEKAVISLKVRGKILENEEILRLAGLFFLYIALLFISGLLFTLLGYTPFGAMSLAFSAQGNVGPVFVQTQDWFALPTEAKIILIAAMWIGRLEILPVLVLISSLLIISRRD
jgi:trk system potassium uptake protein TrkH